MYKRQEVDEACVSFDQGIGSGANLCAVDLDKDGDVDVVVTGKWGGPVWFENKRK